MIQEIEPQFLNTIRIVIKDQKYISIQLETDHQFSIFQEMVVKLNGNFKKSKQKFFIPLKAYTQLKEKIFKEMNCVWIHDIPDFTIQFLSEQLQEKSQNFNHFQTIPKYEYDLEQKKIIQFCIQNQGKFILLNKIVNDLNQNSDRQTQALIAAHQYLHNFPLIIITKKQLIGEWKQKCIDILQIDISQILLVDNLTMEIHNAKIILVSYENCKFINLHNFKIAILDEAQCLKTYNSKRSQTIIPALIKYEQVIMCVEPKSIDKPIQYYNLFLIKNIDIFSNFEDFTNRFCDPKPFQFGKGLDYYGLSNKSEFNTLLETFTFKAEETWKLQGKKFYKNIKKKSQIKLNQYLVEQEEKINHQEIINDQNFDNSYLKQKFINNELSYQEDIIFIQDGKQQSCPVSVNSASQTKIIRNSAPDSFNLLNDQNIPKLIIENTMNQIILDPNLIQTNKKVKTKNYPTVDEIKTQMKKKIQFDQIISLKENIEFSEIQKNYNLQTLYQPQERKNYWQYLKKMA